MLGNGLVPHIPFDNTNVRYIKLRICNRIKLARKAEVEYFGRRAHLVVFAHFLWIALVILGFPVFFSLNFSRWRVFHLLAMVVMQLTKTICPLTYLEAYLKAKCVSNRVYPGQFTIYIYN